MLSDIELDNFLGRLQTEALPLLIRAKAQFRAGTLGGTGAWYQASYGTLIQGTRETVADFIKVISYAYSWLPVNRPAAFPSEDQFKSLLAAINAVRRCSPEKDLQALRRGLIEAAQTAMRIGPSSIVTVSKTLHFWDPNLAPMIDVNVVDGLAALTDQPDPYKLSAMGTTTEGYLAYWEFTDRLIQRHNMTRIGVLDYRQFDELLFQLGSEYNVVGGATPAAAVGRRNKRAEALAIYRARHAEGRQAVLDAFCAALDMNRDTASTYYQYCRTRVLELDADAD